jgi:hypothetical protein
MGGLHNLIAVAWIVVAASSRRSASSPSLKNRSWRGRCDLLGGRGHALPFLPVRGRDLVREGGRSAGGH